VSQDTASIGRAGDSALLRRLNVSAALRAFFQADALAVRELQDVVGVSRPTAEELLRILTEEGRIEEAPVEAEAGRRAGRPARRYRLAPGSGHVAGIDIGAHKVACHIADLRGNVAIVQRARVAAEMPADERLEVAAQVTREAIEAAGLALERLDGIGCGVVGVFRSAERALDVKRAEIGAALHPYSLPGFAQIDIGAELARHLGRDPGEVLVANDVKLAALAEHWLGAARGVEDVVYMFAGRRLGAGVLIGGKVHQGRHGVAGEIGTLPILGWAEAMAGLARTATGGEGEPEDADVEELFRAAAAGDRRARRAVDAVAQGLALGAAALVHAVDPDLVVLGGGMSRAGEIIAEPFRQDLEDICLFPPRVALSQLGGDSVALGAIRMALDAFEGRLLDV
jgi:predicted NBD/HSP70 family sugar kinase